MLYCGGVSQFYPVCDFGYLSIDTVKRLITSHSLRMTPPFHTSSPEHERYTPPLDSRRGRLFDEGGFLQKSNVGPRNLLEV